MNKLYAFIALLACLMCSVSTSAFTLFVEIDNPENLSAVETYYSGSKTALDLTAAMPLTAEFPDDGLRYLYVSPKSGCFITGYTVKDEDGNVLIEKAGAWKSMQAITIRPEYDYGTMYITTSDKQPTDAKLTVNLNGNPANVSMFLGGSRKIDLVQGSQEIEFTSSSESTVYLLPVGVTKFYKVALDGTEKAANGVADEGGAISYQYTLSVKNGSSIDIDVDYPLVYRNCSITVGEGLADFVQSVTLDGVAVEDWTNFQAKMGAKLVIKANTYDYNVETFTVNGRNSSFTVGAWDTIVENDDIDIQMTGSAIERPYTAAVVTYNWNYLGNESKGFYSYEFLRSDNKSINLDAGENIIKFNDVELPLSLRLYADKQEDVHVAVNGEVQTVDAITAVYTLNIKDGDIVQIGLATELPDITTTAINEVHGSKSGVDGSAFNLSGQKVDKNFKGIVIVNGKKYVH